MPPSLTVRDLTRTLGAMPGTTPVMACLPDGSVRSLAGMVTRRRATATLTSVATGYEVAPCAAAVLAHLAMADPSGTLVIAGNGRPGQVTGIRMRGGRAVLQSGHGAAEGSVVPAAPGRTRQSYRPVPGMARSHTSIADA